MPSIYELDWERSTVGSVLNALSDGLRGLERILSAANSSEIEQWQIDDSLEVADNLWGVAFVTSQVYISAVVNSVTHLSRATSKQLKAALLKLHSPLLDGTSITQMQLCDAIANYYKHHEEWGRWSRTRGNEKTFDVLVAAGFTAVDVYYCDKAAGLLFGNNGRYCDALFEMITVWRDAVVENTVSGTTTPN
jgi:hypothetical protein